MMSRAIHICVAALLLFQIAASINLDFYKASKCDQFGVSCKNFDLNKCCAATNGGKVFYASVQASDYPKKANDGYKLGMVAYERAATTNDCGKEITHVERMSDGKSDVSKCVSTGAYISGAMHYYSPVQSGVDAKAGEGQHDTGGEIVQADHVFYRDGLQIYYMSMDNDTKMAAWEDLVKEENGLAMLNFMLAEYGSVVQL